ncbi:MAG: hypothetical protein AAFN00_20795 [Cyanobacteria bacterium J06558_2]
MDSQDKSERRLVKGIINDLCIERSLFSLKKGDRFLMIIVLIMRFLYF